MNASFLKHLFLGSLLVFLTVAPCLVLGQEDIGRISNAELKQLKRELKPFIQDQLPKVSGSLKSGDMFSLQNLFAFQIADSLEVNDTKEKVLEAKIQHIKTDPGLELKADYLQNIEEGIVDVQSGGAFYRRRGLITFEWDVLDNGLVEGNYRAKALKEKLRLNRLQQENEVKNQAYNRLFTSFKGTFNQIKSKKLRTRKKVLEKQLKVKRKLFKNDLVLWDDVIQTLSEKRKVQNQLSTIQQFNDNVPEDQVAGVDPRFLPVVDIQIEKVMDDIRTPKRVDSFVDARKKLLQYQYAPVRDISLSPYFRYNVYNNPDRYVNDDGSTTAYREFFSFGLSFSTPLKFDFEEKQNLIGAELDHIEAQQLKKTESHLKEVLDHYNEYQKHLSQYIKKYHERAEVIEKIRQEKAKKRIDQNAYSPVKVIKWMNRLSAINFELYDQQQKMYIELLNIHPYMQEKQMIDVVKPLNIKDQIPDLQTEKTVYIWSATFSAYSNPELVQHLKDHDIQRVMLSLGPNDSLVDKARKFIPLARDSDIASHIMIGNNRLFFQDRRDKIKAFIKSAQKLGAEGVHFDVEPHVLDTWEANEERYKNQLISMVKYANQKTEASGLKIGVSIPLFYERRVLQSIYPYCDQVYIMAYKQKDLQYLKEKLMRDLQIDLDKTTVALRPEDFQNTTKLASFIFKLKQFTRVQRYALHDLEKLLSMDHESSD